MKGARIDITLCNVLLYHTTASFSEKWIFNFLQSMEPSFIVRRMEPPYVEEKMGSYDTENAFSTWNTVWKWHWVPKQQGIQRQAFDTVCTQLLMHLKRYIILLLTYEPIIFSKMKPSSFLHQMERMFLKREMDFYDAEKFICICDRVRK